MSRFLKNEWLQLIILAVPFVLIAIFWNQIPDRVPIHWNYEGHADNFGSKAVGLFIVPWSISVLPLFWEVWVESILNISI